MQLRLAMVDADRIMHCPISPTVLEDQPTARSELQSSKLDAGPHGPDSSRSVGPDLETYTLWLPGHFGIAAFMNPSSKHGLGGTAINWEMLFVCLFPFMSGHWFFCFRLQKDCGGNGQMILIKE